MIGIVVAAHSSLSQLLQFGININTMILCAGNNMHYTMLILDHAAQSYDCFVQIPASRRNVRNSGIHWIARQSTFKDSLSIDIKFNIYARSATLTCFVISFLKRNTGLIT